MPLGITVAHNLAQNGATALIRMTPSIMTLSRRVRSRMTVALCPFTNEDGTMTLIRTVFSRMAITITALSTYNNGAMTFIRMPLSRTTQSRTTLSTNVHIC
jgi:hypothetical protein